MNAPVTITPMTPGRKPARSLKPQSGKINLPKSKLKKPEAAKSDNAPASPTPLQILLALESEAMACADRLALKHVAVNKARALIDCGHIFFLTRSGQAFKIEAVSSQATVEKNAPMMQWLTRQMKYMAKAGPLSAPLGFALDPLDGDIDYPFPHAFYAPFSPDPKTGGLLYTRSEPWKEDAQQIPARLAQVYGLQWTALGAKKRARLTPKKRLWLSAVALITAIALCVPVPISTLAPAQIVAADPFLITPALDGVIKTIHVDPNVIVSQGDTLITLENTDLKNELSVASEEHSVATARLRKASLSAFVDAQTKREIAVARAEQSLAQTRMDYAAKRLDKTIITAPKSGLLLYSDPKDWTGRPVATGERIMEIADPAAVLLRLEAPLVDSAALTQNADVRLFLDSDPLRGHDGTLLRSAYYAQPQAGGELAYEAYANLDALPPGARIGARGVAKIYGPKAPLGYWLARRPISAARQFLGL